MSSEGLTFWLVWIQKHVLRNIEYHVYGVFLQQLILLIVGFLTFFFEVTNFSVSQDQTLRSNIKINLFNPCLGVTGPDHGEPHLDAGHRHHLRQHPAGGRIPKISLPPSSQPAVNSGRKNNNPFFQSLPATPYFKMIDIWLFFSMNLMVVSDQIKRGFCHRASMLAGCLPYLPHLPGICRTNSGEEREEVPISLSSKLAISRYAAKDVLVFLRVMNCYRLLT